MQPSRISNRGPLVMLIGLMAGTAGAIAWLLSPARDAMAHRSSGPIADERRFEPRAKMDTSGFTTVVESLPRWSPDASLKEIGLIWNEIARSDRTRIDTALSSPKLSPNDRMTLSTMKAMLLNYEGEAKKGYEVLEETRRWVERDPRFAKRG